MRIEEEPRSIISITLETFRKVGPRIIRTSAIEESIFPDHPRSVNEIITYHFSTHISNMEEKSFTRQGRVFFSIIFNSL